MKPIENGSDVTECVHDLLAILKLAMRYVPVSAVEYAENREAVYLHPTASAAITKAERIEQWKP